MGHQKQLCNYCFVFVQINQLVDKILFWLFKQRKSWVQTLNNVSLKTYCQHHDVKNRLFTCIIRQFLLYYKKVIQVLAIHKTFAVQTNQILQYKPINVLIKSYYKFLQIIKLFYFNWHLNHLTLIAEIGFYDFIFCLSGIFIFKLTPEERKYEAFMIIITNLNNTSC